MNETPPADAWTLNPDDAAALDALLEHGGGLSAAGDSDSDPDSGVARCLAVIAALPKPTADADVAAGRRRGCGVPVWLLAADARG